MHGLAVGELSDQLQPHRHHGSAPQGRDRRPAAGERQGHTAEEDSRGADRRTSEEYRQVSLARLVRLICK